MRYYEEDRRQCQVVTKRKKRCSRVGTHSGGGILRCEAHHKAYIKSKEKKK